jgi:hypothetical protein
MATSQESPQSETGKEANGHNGSRDRTRKTVVRAATIAAASGATALAARKVLDRDSGKQEGERKSSSGQSGDLSVVTSMVSSAWDSARESLVPMIEDAAENAGEYLGRNAPEVVRETVVPRFISGFQRARKGSDGGE